jgi:hypothetical protein
LDSKSVLSLFVDWGGGGGLHSLSIWKGYDLAVLREDWNSCNLEAKSVISSVIRGKQERPSTLLSPVLSVWQAHFIHCWSNFMSTSYLQHSPHNYSF